MRLTVNSFVHSRVGEKAMSRLSVGQFHHQRDCSKVTSTLVYVEWEIHPK